MIIQGNNDMPLERSSREEFKENNVELVKSDSLERKHQRKERSKKLKRKHSFISENLQQFNSNHENLKNASQICQSDLEELRTVYKKCKKIVKKIESKYGHLLELENSDVTSESNSAESERCTCALNKKIVFSDDGTEVILEPDLTNHICPKKLSTKNTSKDNHTLEIEYEKADTLPEDLLRLTNLLRDPNLEKTVRNKVISKIRLLKEEYMNDVRFNKQAIIEKAKSNPDEVIDFRGTNFSGLPGYIM
ncbi:uncharacterized protein LOC132902944 [Amyelois transitella]|uniref:uncharacterized protein LOC132902944 n=1 Tax=Amyelois transitella TaxID=680683 RepID=UPI0029901C6E|nr:uncharacterized protein LOC132902944 [Amyelois transitella]